MAQKNPYRRKSAVSIPTAAHPLSKAVFALMREHGVTYDELEYRSGVLRSTFKAWRTSNRPGLDTIEAALGVFGYSALPVPPASALPPELRADLEAVAAKHGTESLPVLEFISAAVNRRPTTTIDARTRLRDPGERLVRAA
jgi:transcriptional regulator with XRE-family HTH domain